MLFKDGPRDKKTGGKESQGAAEDNVPGRRPPGRGRFPCQVSPALRAVMGGVRIVSMASPADHGLFPL